MTIAPTTTPTTQQPAASQTSTASAPSSSRLTGNFDTFLTLLTNQLKNQDPLSPTDTSQFTQQLVQFSQVEQQIETNSLLKSIVGQQSSGAVNYLGATAVFDSPVAQLSADEPANYEITLPAGAARASVVLRDARGTVVSTQPLTAPLGTNPRTVTFDGRLANGGTAPPGPYRLEIQAEGADGGKLTGGSVHVREQITGIDLSGTDPKYLTRSGTRSFDDILSLSL